MLYLLYEEGIILLIGSFDKSFVRSKPSKSKLVTISGVFLGRGNCWGPPPRRISNVSMRTEKKKYHNIYSMYWLDFINLFLRRTAEFVEKKKAIHYQFSRPFTVNRCLSLDLYHCTYYNLFYRRLI